MTIDRMTVMVRGETYELVPDDCECERCALTGCCDRLGAPRYNNRAPCVVLGGIFRRDSRRGRREAEHGRGGCWAAARAGRLRNKLENKKGKTR